MSSVFNSMNPIQLGSRAASSLSQASLVAPCVGDVWFFTPSGKAKHARAEGIHGGV